MAFVLYLLYLCSVILFLYIRTILMESILITGASGFIGSFIVEEALKRKFGVWAGIRPTSSKRYLKNRKIHSVSIKPECRFFLLLNKKKKIFFIRNYKKSQNIEVI